MREYPERSLSIVDSVLRSEELASDTQEYMAAAAQIETGFSNYEYTQIIKKRLLGVLNGTESDWNNWKWQMQNRICDADTLSSIIDLGATQKHQIEKTAKTYRWAISPYYLSLITKNHTDNPIFKMGVPDIRELVPGGIPDPMDEEHTSPAPLITRRYPDRLIINATNQCAMYCRHCQRRRNIGETDKNAGREDIQAALTYIASHPEIRDVLITGGDALLLSDKTLEWILAELYDLPHVEIVRIGTRVPVTLPQRITPALCEILAAYPPIYINTQFNHPLEITPDSKLACDRLVNAGVVLGNQAVLLRDINDDAHTMRKLNHELLKIRVRPYYIFHAKNVIGTNHWQTDLQTGLDIMNSLRGHTSGLANPTYIYNAPGGLGKIPVMPNYMMNRQGNTTYLRTWENKIVKVCDIDY
ncbi:Aldolase-type TIM barrel [Syntrophomonas zehnderi OL-4]|uniref:Aldolase-type TIM barrel n=1 Tax=Syntrophomonas zehnderi OL-4 TaxID=690567 RepID=A0A0E4GC26_9FIRM|nr:KamA family radical SAM protein [Syntrophomonas zehnderi]CFX69226.1 Aldolase-type TIM barrel [Syntrophomonas zehnderi OL-4]